MLLSSAHLYGVKDLVHVLDEELVSLLDTDNVWLMLQEAVEYNMTHLEKAAEEFLKSNMHVIKVVPDIIPNFIEPWFASVPWIHNFTIHIINRLFCPVYAMARRSMWWSWRCEMIITHDLFSLAQDFLAKISLSGRCSWYLYIVRSDGAYFFIFDAIVPNMNLIIFVWGHIGKQI